MNSKRYYVRTPSIQEVVFEAIGRKQGRSPASNAGPTTSKPNVQETSKCKRCGRGPHSRQSCPTKDAVCHKCKRTGHYGAQRFSKRVGEVTSQTESVYDTSYFTAVITDDKQTTWNATISLNGEDVPFKLDTRAEVTVISESKLSAITTEELQSSTKRLCSPDKRPVVVAGQMSATLQFKASTCEQMVYVVKDLQQNLLGLPAIQALHILTVVDAVEAQYPASDEHFTGLGTFPQSFKIQLSPDTKPFALFTPRAVRIPLRKKV